MFIILVQINSHVFVYYFEIFPYNARLYPILFAIGTFLAFEESRGGLDSLKNLTGPKLYFKNFILFYLFWIGACMLDVDLGHRKFFGTKWGFKWWQNFYTLWVPITTEYIYLISTVSLFLLALTSDGV